MAFSSYSLCLFAENREFTENGVISTIILYRCAHWKSIENIMKEY